MRLINSSLPPLTIGTVQSGVVELTDMYHITGIATPHQIVKDIIYPQTVGRDYMVMGGQQDDGTALVVSFGENGQHHNRLYESSYTAFWNMIKRIDTVLRLEPVTTVSCYLFSEQKMRVEFTLDGCPFPFGFHDRQLIGCVFTMKISRYLDTTDPYAREYIRG